MSSSTCLSIIVPSHGASDVAELCDSIIKQECDFSFEVLIVANPPNSRLQNNLKRYGSIFKYLSSEKIGVNRARNLGLLFAKGQFCLFLDDDCVLAGCDFLSRLMEQLKTRVQALVGGTYVIRGKVKRLDWVYNLIQTNWLHSGVNSISRKTQYLLGGNFAGPTELLKSHLFDENIRFGGAETELFLRLQKHHVELFLIEGLEVHHNTFLTYHRFLKKAYLQGRGSSYIENKGLAHVAACRSYVAVANENRMKENYFSNFYYESYRLFFQVGQILCREDKKFLFRGVYLVLKIANEQFYVFTRRRLEFLEKLLSSVLRK